MNGELGMCEYGWETGNMWMIHCSDGTEGVSAQVYHRDVDGDVAPTYRWCMPVGVGRPGKVHRYYMAGGDGDVA